MKYDCLNDSAIIIAESCKISQCGFHNMLRKQLKDHPQWIENISTVSQLKKQLAVTPSAIVLLSVQLKEFDAYNTIRELKVSYPGLKNHINFY
jgi:DNA-binding NarL/FixJ family response regulator